MEGDSADTKPVTVSQQEYSIQWKTGLSSYFRGDTEHDAEFNEGLSDDFGKILLIVQVPSSCIFDRMLQNDACNATSRNRKDTGFHKDLITIFARISSRGYTTSLTLTLIICIVIG